MVEKPKHFDEELNELLLRILALKKKAIANLSTKSSDKNKSAGDNKNK